VTPNQSKRAAAFLLSAHRLGGEGRGEAGSLLKLLGFAFTFFVMFTVQICTAAEPFAVLEPSAFAHHTEHFNTMETETIVTDIPNAESWPWLQKNIPLFECPDGVVEEIYYFRWWSFRKHIKQTPKGYVVTEFLPPVNHAGEFNTISCAAGFHLAEGRWLRDDRYLDDYTQFWLRGDQGKPQPHFHKFSSWFAAAAWDRYLVNADKKFLVNLLPDLVADYRAWETERQLTNGLFWQYDVRDGMEESISGSRTNKNIRPTINSYMFANADAIANLARLAKQTKLEHEFSTKAKSLRQLVQTNLWNQDAKFFEVLTPGATGNSYNLPNVREAIGYIPWMFYLPTPDHGYEAAWAQFLDPQGFSAPFGITTAERRHPDFRSHGIGTCEWDGAIWPFATSQTLGALAILLREYQQPFVTSQNYFVAFLRYTRSQHAGEKPYIGEYLDEVTGDWINRGDRSCYYNHSTYADLLITGVVGLRPRPDNIAEIHPLLPPNTWDWFCLDGVKYHDHMLTVIWDKDGSRYGRGAGLRLLVNGKEIAQANKLERVTGKLP